MFSPNDMVPPIGGVKKQTNGTYTQIFDATGKLIASDFYAGDPDYFDDKDEKLHSDDYRTQFYYPFTTDSFIKHY